MTLAAFLTFAGLVIFAAISPGPAVLMSARTGLTEGFRTGVMLALGIASGAVIWAMAAMAFWSSWLAASSVMPSGPAWGGSGVLGSRMVCFKSMKS